MLEVQGGSLKHRDNKLGQVVTLTVGNSLSIQGLTVKLESLKAYLNDEILGKLKSTAILKVSKGNITDDITLGEFAETMKFTMGHNFMLVSAHNQEAKIRVSEFTLSLDASELDPLHKLIPIEYKKEIQVGDYVVIVKELSHVDEYGSYFSLNLSVGKAEKTQEFFTAGPVSFDNVKISLNIVDFSKGTLQINRLSLGDTFKIVKGQNIELKSPGIKLELVDEVDNHKDKLEYTLKISKGKFVFVGKIVQSYIVPVIGHIPPGKTPMLKRKLDRKRSHLVYTFDMYSIENVILYEDMNSENRNSFLVQKTN